MVNRQLRRGLFGRRRRENVPGGRQVRHEVKVTPEEEGRLPDGKWQQIAEDFIALMEFDDQQGTRDPCRWAVIHHGVSKNRNDHIHIVVDLVREDGTKANTFRDFQRAQTAARALENKYGLEPLESARTGRATRGYDPAEREAQARGRAWAKYKRSRGGDAPGREVLEPSLEAWEQCNAELRRVIDEIRQVGVDDDATWAAMARRGAGVLASWSRAVEIVPGDLARAAEALSRSAQPRRLVALPARANWDVFTDAAVLAAAASRGGKGEVGQAVLIRFMLRLAQAVHDAAVATDQARHAALLVQDTRARLIAVRDALPPLPGSQSRHAPETLQLDPELQARMRRVQSARPDDGKLASPLPPPEVPRARRSTALETPNPSIER